MHFYEHTATHAFKIAKQKLGQQKVNGILYYSNETLKKKINK